MCGVALCFGCGGSGSTPPVPDGGTIPRALEIVGDDSVGLAFGQRATLMVRVREVGGGPVAGARVDFEIAADLPNESPGGSALSTATATSGADGTARVDVVAGAALASFRVVAESADALSAAWSIGVSDVGFAALDVTPTQVGERAGLTGLEVRLYSGGTHCAALSASAPAPSPFPARSLAGLGATAAFDNLAPGDGYAVLSWIVGDGGLVSAAGCVDLAPRTLRAGGRVRLPLPVVDLPLAAAASYTVTSTFDLAPVRARLLAAGAPWARASCPLGAAELFLDCAIDALDGGDGDCVVEQPGVVAAALQARRGPPADGCRPATVDGVKTLDAAIMELLAPAPASPAAQLAGTAAALGDLLDSLVVESTLAPGTPTAAQALGRVTLESSGTLFVQDLRTTARPLLLASAAAVQRGDELELALFGYTLRLGTLAADALRERGLVDGEVSELGSGIVAAAGCPALSATACGLAGRTSDCLQAACGASLAGFDALLGSPFVLLDGDGVDFLVEGGVVLMDADHDLVAEELLAGTWTATTRLQGGEEVTFFGAFQARAQ